MIDFLRGKLYSKDIDDKWGISAERDSNAWKVQHRVETDRDENRNTLPILEYREEIEKMIRENETSIIIWETGSGKTTQLPQMVSEVIWEDKKIFVTQPRKMAATSVSGFVAKQNWTRLWDTVWYQIRFDDTTHLWTRISFGTEWILLAKFHEDPLLEEYSCVIVDEVAPIYKVSEFEPAVVDISVVVPLSWSPKEPPFSETHQVSWSAL